MHAFAHVRERWICARAPVKSGMRRCCGMPCWSAMLLCSAVLVCRAPVVCRADLSCYSGLPCWPAALLRRGSAVLLDMPCCSAAVLWFIMLICRSPVVFRSALVLVCRAAVVCRSEGRLQRATSTSQVSEDVCSESLIFEERRRTTDHPIIPCWGDASSEALVLIRGDACNFWVW